MLDDARRRGVAADRLEVSAAAEGTTVDLADS